MGQKTVDDLIYKNELEEWNERPDVTLVTTVDPGGETPAWKGQIGFVPTILEKNGTQSRKYDCRGLWTPYNDKVYFPCFGKSRI
jgi:Oxidoreductase NAD-binding domain.